MKQKEIKNFLEEAANPDCPAERRDEIQRLILEGIYTDSQGRCLVCDNEKSRGIELLLEKLFAFPHLFPGLWIVFVLACGDRPRQCIFADVE